MKKVKLNIYERSLINPQNSFQIGFKNAPQEFKIYLIEDEIGEILT